MKFDAGFAILLDVKIVLKIVFYIQMLIRVVRNANMLGILSFAPIISQKHS